MSSRIAVHIIITMAGMALFLPFLGLQPLFDWDEINFAESAREMIVSGNYSTVQIGFEPFWEKPPLFIWMQVGCMKIFGVSEFAARLPNAICGIITLNLLYPFGIKIRNHFTGIFWVVAYGASLAPAVYYRTGIIDPVFNLFIFLSVWNLFRAENLVAEKNNARWNVLLAGLFAGLAVLTKGPVAVLIVFVVWLIRFILNPRHAWYGGLNIFMSLLAFSLTLSVWIIPEWLRSGNWFFSQFIKYQFELAQGQIETHNQPWFYHIIVLLFLCFPASIYALSQLFRSTELSGPDRLWSAYMRSLFWVVLIIFSLVTTKIIHYSSLCWIPLGWFAGNMLYKKHTQRSNIPRWLLIPYGIVVFIIGILITVIPLIVTNSELGRIAIPYINDAIAVATIQENRAWSGLEWIPGAFLLITGLLCLFNFRKWQGHWPFTFAAIFGILFSAILLPRAESSLQHEYIDQIRKLKEEDAYIESWGFKTYAIYFYSEPGPDKFKGEWQTELHNYRQFRNPNTQARLDYLMNKPVGKRVYIFTRINYQPDKYFAEKFRYLRKCGAYVLWIRKDLEKGNIGM